MGKLTKAEMAKQQEAFDRKMEGLANESNQLSDPPAEVIINLETEKENIMETMKIEVTRDAVVSLAKEMNSILIDCKIPTGKNNNQQVMTAQILSHADELLYSDFILTDENDKRVIFSIEAQETLVALGQVIPQPPVRKAVDVRAARGTTAKKEKKTAGYTRQQALVDAIRELKSATKDEIIAKANGLYRAVNPAEDNPNPTNWSGDRALADKHITSKALLAALPILLAFGTLSETEGKYSIPAPPEAV